MKPSQFIQGTTSLTHAESSGSTLMNSVRAKVPLPWKANFNVGGRHQFIVRLIQANAALYAGYLVASGPVAQ